MSMFINRNTYAVTRTYDPDLEWNRLLNSGILKSVEKDGTHVDLFD